LSVSVYFDAADVDGNDINRETEDTRQAIAATKGGKGLRLCDVAVGRRVVGSLELKDIVSVHVEREMPRVGLLDDAECCPGTEVLQNEYWNHHRMEDHVGRRGTEWGKIKQDILKITTVNGGTLLLRFYSDFADAEANPLRLAGENEETGALFKDNAFQWAQTIGRFCGPEQLKQALPHFGEDTADELRDFLIVKHDEVDKGHRRLASLPRSVSMWNLSRAADAPATTRGLMRRGSSIGEKGQVRPPSKLPKASFHRSSSLDDSVLTSGHGSTVSTSHRRAGTSVDLATTSLQSSFGVGASFAAGGSYHPSSFGSGPSAAPADTKPDKGEDDDEFFIGDAV
jgi:hypothetical protein